MSKYGAIILFTCVERVYICKTPYKHTFEKKLKYVGHVKGAVRRFGEDFTVFI